MSKDNKYVSVNSLISTTQNDGYKFFLKNKDAYENKEMFQKLDDENQSYDDKFNNYKNNYFCQELTQTNHLDKEFSLPMENFVNAFNMQEKRKSQDNNLIITINKNGIHKKFETIKYTYKIGNKISRRKSGRKQNIIAKIIRNFIQDIIPLWVKCIEPGKNNKLNKDKIINNFKNYLGVSLFEIFQNQINISNYSKKDITYIKLQFTLKEAFTCFESKESFIRKNILFNVLNRLKLNEVNYDEKSFFNALEDINYYIKRKAENEEEANKFKKAFDDIIKDLSD